jgi:hypothetical protein
MAFRPYGRLQGVDGNADQGVGGVWIGRHAVLMDALIHDSCLKEGVKPEKQHVPSSTDPVHKQHSQHSS